MECCCEALMFWPSDLEWDRVVDQRVRVEAAVVEDLANLSMESKEINGQEWVRDLTSRCATRGAVVSVRTVSARSIVRVVVCVAVDQTVSFAIGTIRVVLQSAIEQISASGCELFEDLGRWWCFLMEGRDLIGAATKVSFSRFPLPPDSLLAAWLRTQGICSRPS
jgi:hypothetical protein